MKGKYALGPQYFVSIIARVNKIACHLKPINSKGKASRSWLAVWERHMVSYSICYSPKTFVADCAFFAASIEVT